MGQKPDDRTMVPLCWNHHTGSAGVHLVGERVFWELHKVEPRQVAERCWARYSAEKEGRAA